MMILVQPQLSKQYKPILDDLIENSMLDYEHIFSVVVPTFIRSYS